MKITEKQLREIIKESVRHYIKESSNSGMIEGVAYYNPCEALCDSGIEFDEENTYLLGGNIQSLDKILNQDYKITFKGYGYDYPGDYVTPPDCGVSHISLSDDGGISTLIKQLQDINPELGQALENNYKNWCEEAIDDAKDGYGSIVEWDWQGLTLGGHDYEEF